MALLDLSSDLSRFRSKVSGEEKNTPEASKATNNKNFATFQPITEKLSSFSPTINKTTPANLESKLSSTKLDDIRKFAQENLLINSVSKYSAVNVNYNEETLSRISTEQVASRFNKIQQKEFVSNLTKSNVVVLQPSGEKNNQSPIDIVINKEDASDNIQNPNIVITRPALSIDRRASSPNISINKEDATDNIENPNIVINKIPLTLDRTQSTPKIYINKNESVNNIENPNVDILRKPLSFDRKKQTPNIITETVKQGLVVNPNTDVIRIENGTFHLDDESELNPSGKTIRFVTESRLVNKEVTPQKDTQRYDGVSEQLVDNSELNLDTVIKTIPFGRNEDPSKSKFSIIGVQQVNFFKDDNAKGFVVNAQKNESQYKQNSFFSWKGKTPPSVNFITDVNAKGFQTFTNSGITAYNTDSSKFGFRIAPEVDFFDVIKKYTSEGFKKFVTMLRSVYQPDASQFGWVGKREAAPEANYFDKENKNTTAGFHKFAQIYDTKYLTDSSNYDWDGKREAAPEANYFDRTGKNTTAGFHKFAQVYDTKYVPESSVFDWDGNRESAPEVNYFDITSKNTTAGFHRFAQIYDTKYVHESSIFDWDGNRTDAPEVDFFDITKRNTTAGFHRFAQIYDTKYVHESSIFDWDGVRTDAPEVNYFDITGKNTTAGFHRFAQLYDTKYVHESSIFDWDGVRTDAPAVDYFDITKRNTTVGFHTFAQIYDTKYVHESSIFDWDGKRPDAPAVDFFDITKRNTTAGFHTFAQIYDTKYVHESSVFDWDGKRIDAPAVDYFDITKKNTTIGFHTFAQIYDTKYVHESSVFDWDGIRTNAPEVNYFDITGKFTTQGFHRLAQKYDTKYVKESSEFDWDGNRTSAPEVNYFDISKTYTSAGFHKLAELYDSKYVKDSSRFDWDGSRTSAPTTNFFANDNATGFTKLAPKLQTEYKTDSSQFTFKGTLPEPVDFFSNTEASGFIIKIPALESKYNKDVSKFTFKGEVPQPVDFFPNTQADGFVIKTPKLESKYKEDISSFVFKGKRTSAPSVDYIDNNFAQGFTNFAQSLFSEYKPKKSRFTWLGARQDAPAVNYFKIPNINPDAIEGFTTLFVDKTQTKYSDRLSLFSIESSNKKSPVKNVPYTTFFGYRPSERTGFMVGMTTFDGTLYPIIDPVLKFDANQSQRVTISTIRGENPAALKTTQAEIYAPLSLGKRPWANGTLFSTLENQITNPKTHAPGGSYLSKYERTMKDTTNKLGYLTKWSTTRRSPSPLDDQYSKYKLQDEAVNNEVAAFNQPYVVRGIQRRGEVENQRWGFGVNFDDGIVRGGVVTQAERILQDVFRIGKFTLSVKGLLFNVKQLGLQAMNPAVDVDPNTSTSGILGLSSTLIYNPLTMIGNVASARAGVHLARHGAFPFDSAYLNKYETATTNRELNQRFSASEQKKFDNLRAPAVPGDQTDYNRLIGLIKELLPGSFKPTTTSSDTLSIGGAVTAVKNILGKREIIRLTSLFGGAQSFLGIGGTSIRRSSHPYLVNYTTSPALQKSVNRTGLGEIGQSVLSQQQPQYEDSAKRDIFFAYNYRYSEYYKDDGSYTGFIGALDKILKADASGNVADGLKMPGGISPDTLTRIEKLDPYNPADRHFSSRAQATTADNADSHRNDAYMLGENTFFSGSNQTYGEAYKSSEGFLAVQNLSYQLGGAKKENSTATGSSPVGTQSDVVNTIRGKQPFSPQYRLPNERVTRIISTNVEHSIDTGKNLHLGPHLPPGGTPDNIPVIQKYRTLAYGKLQKVKSGPGERSALFNDFRHDLELSGSESFITNPSLIKFQSRNLEDYFGLGKHGKPGAQRNIPFVSNVLYDSSDKNINPLNPNLTPKQLEEAKKFQRYSVPKLKDGQEFRGDRINIIDYKRANFNITRDFVYEKGDYSPKNLPGKNDLIDFYFTSLVLSGHNYCPAEVIVFRAIFDSISDNHKPSWNSVKYMGRADPLYVYQGYERSISFGFTVHIGSRDEMKATWRKLNYLASWTAPEYTTFGGYIRGPMCRINIGNLYRKMPGYISNLSYTFDNSNGYWETANLTEELLSENGSQKNKNLSNPGVLQLPKIIQVSCEFVPIGMYRPEKNGVMYSLYDDDGNPENGLIPKHKSKTNYFKTFDDLPIDGDLNKFNLTIPVGEEGKAVTGSFEDNPQDLQG